MPVLIQYYLTCSGCGATAQEQVGDKMFNLFGETDLEVREEACDLGWWTNAFDDSCDERHAKDFCPTCVANKKHLKIRE